MKLSKVHMGLLAEVQAGRVYRTGGISTGVSTTEAGRDVTVAAEALRREALVTLAKPDFFGGGRWSTTRRQYVLMPAGRAALESAS